jgi:hypothetical protein
MPEYEPIGISEPALSDVTVDKQGQVHAGFRLSATPAGEWVNAFNERAADVPSLRLAPYGDTARVEIGPVREEELTQVVASLRAIVDAANKAIEPLRAQEAAAVDTERRKIERAHRTIIEELGRPGSV